MSTNRFSQWTKKIAISLGSASLCFGLLNLDAKAEATAFFEFKIDPATSFIRTHNDPYAKNAIPIALEPLGIRAGEEILLERLGDFSAWSNPNRDYVESMMGVFSSSDELLPSNLLERVPGAIDAGNDVVTLTTDFGELATDIPEDFSISDSISIQVPNNATHLFVAARDTAYGDNIDPDGDFAVRIVQPVPEPSSVLGLLLLGTCGAAGSLRKRKLQRKVESSGDR